ncbi:MAG: hypothetical protein IMY84_05810 [Chloroflexi bacterium]|nr:hypothetical protein [Chloroflexota bacterium]
MDDIYFWVLRIWHALTSNKKALVGVLGAVAVVVTVTTVLAAPPSMDGQGGEQEEAAQAPAVTAEVVVEPTEEFSIGGISDAGLLPSSPFYFAKEIVRGLRCAFTFDWVDKANLRLQYANEDILAVRELCDEGEYVLAAKHCKQYQDNFFNSLAWTVKAGKQGDDVQALMTNLRSAHHGHMVVLVDALYWHQDWSRDAAIDAVTFTSAPFEQVIAWIEGSAEAAMFRAKLESDFSSFDAELWREIESRLGLEPEQAMALSEAMGDTSVVGGAPIITSVRADGAHLEPGDTCSITCMATALDGDVLSYEWLAASGSIEGEGATVSWTAPEEPGLYMVTAVVSDEEGNQASKSVSLRVGEAEEESEEGPGGPFWIDGFEVEPDRHGLLKPPALGSRQWVVFQGRPVIITCVVDGTTSGLRYDWSCVRLKSDPTKVGGYIETDGAAGAITGSGESIVWEAFDGAGYARVSVVVSNGSDVEESDSVDFRVSTCGNCF